MTIDVEKLFGGPEEPEEQPEEVSIRERLAEMYAEGTPVRFDQMGTELTGTVRGISSLAVPMLGGVPAYIVALDDPSLVPPIKEGDEEISYPFTSMAIPQFMAQKIEDTEPKE